ncbi:MAG: winged helix-turn-helix transcriptional regulator [Candidatus Aenigmarchaeota archaeon]|nr:winged helix-turn-helix transcriptional regulator [Candidatus Aenigmarchaeota archaeon]
MKFREFAENLLGSKVKIKILRHIIREEAITSERELAKIIGVSHGAVNKALKDLQDINLITPLRIGNVIAWKINKDSLAYLCINKKIFSPAEVLKDEIKNHLEHIGYIKKAIIYGSISDRREHASSDIDIFILVEKEHRKKDVINNLSELTNKCIMLFGNKISPNIFSENDLKSKKNKEILENINKGILVFER